MADIDDARAADDGPRTEEPRTAEPRTVEPRTATDRPAPGRYYHSELDVLRFGAFFLVYLHHVFPRTPQGYVENGIGGAAILASLANACGFGLPLFFFLSAFLITTLLRRERLTYRRISVKDFYVRRALRIWPLYYAAVAVGALLVAHPYAPGDFGDPRMMLMYGAFVGNWFFAAGRAAWPMNPITPLWSISVEEQFYAVWPLCVAGLTRRGLLRACALVVAVAAGLGFVLGSRHLDVDAVIWTNSLIQLELFAGGAILALVLEGSVPRIGGHRRLALLVLGAAFWLAAVSLKVKYVGPGVSGWSIAVGYLLVTGGCAAAVLATYGLRLRWPVFVYLGRISFGLYVFHLPALAVIHNLNDGSNGLARRVLLDMTAALALTILAAMVSYRMLETPFLRLKDRFTLLRSRPI